jgi:LmbE family N-acetylglucosaminyl deacetylase
VVTHDPRDDDDEILDHGHHKALGALVEIAVRAAADERYPGGKPHVVEEFVSIAPQQVKADVTLEVGTAMRKKLMAEHASQFDLGKLTSVGARSTESFVVRWRVAGAAVPPGGSLLGAWAR